MRIIHARGETSTSFSSLQDWPARARIAYDGMAPYLHVIVLAAPLAVVGGVILLRVRRRSGVANDWWAWAGLAVGSWPSAGLRHRHRRPCGYGWWAPLTG